MAKGRNKAKIRQTTPRPKMNEPRKDSRQVVDSLLDKMEEGREYGSIVSLVPRPDLNLFDEIVKAINRIEEIRKRPCLVYSGNVVRRDTGGSGVDSTDDLPFMEMVKGVPKEFDKVDVFISTRGGSAHQISRFVNALHSRFKEVDILIPSYCMSAGTLFALAGNHIWMTETACLGPIDPQIPTKEGRYVPAQALLLLVEKLQIEGQNALAKNHPVPWTAIRIVDSIDKKELGDAITASHYSQMMATEFLTKYKFRDWSIRETSQQPAIPAYKEARAVEIAEALASHDRWKSHGHAISRDILWEEIKLKINHPETALESAMNRFWALLFYMFDKTQALKIIASSNYHFVRHEVQRSEK